jgi:integrase/recombinase XerD
MARRGERFAAPVPGDVDDPRSWRRVVDDYLVTLELRGLSPATVHGRRKSLAQLATWCLERSVVHPDVVSVDVLDAYRRHLHHRVTRSGTRLGVRSQQQHLIAARGLFGWMFRQRLIVVNPAGELELPKTPERLPRVILSVEQAEAVMAVPDLASVLGQRDRVMLEVLYATGVRRSELAGLDVADVNVAKRTLFVREGKGARDRIVPLGERATAWLTRYLADTRDVLLGDQFAESALFVTKDGTRICTAHVGKIVETCLRAAGVGDGSCHVFRHTLATFMLEGGADIRWVQAMLGHRNLTSTQLYTHVDITRLAQVHAATHPAASNRPRRRAQELAPVVELRHRARPRDDH